MCVTQGDGQRVSGIGLGRFLEAEQNAHHVLNLHLVRTSAADDGLLDRSRRVLGHRQVAHDGGADGGTACLSEL